jgi:DNA-binding GntR family transcriptional regulator
MKIVKASLHDGAVTRIRDMIVEGDLVPGSRIPEKRLCEEFGISRTPLREALKVLATEGLVLLLPNRGARVAEITAKDVEDMFQVMGALEGLSGELACRHITPAQLAEIRALHYEMLLHHARGELAPYFKLNQRIHEAIVACADNAVLGAMVAGLAGRIRRARYRANLSRERWDQAVREHEEILDALTRRDGERLGQLLRDHLRHKYEAIAEDARAVTTAARPAEAPPGEYIPAENIPAA